MIFNSKNFKLISMYMNVLAPYIDAYYNILQCIDYLEIDRLYSEVEILDSIDERINGLMEDKVISSCKITQLFKIFKRFFLIIINFFCLKK